MRLATIAAVGIVVWTVSAGVSVMSQRRVVSAPASKGTAAVEAGGLIFVSAIRGVDDGSGPVTDVATQTRRALERLRDVLGRAGSSLAQTATVHVYLKSASDFETMNGVYREFFAASAPTRTTVVADLGGGALVQVAAIAVPTGASREAMHPAGWMKSPRPYSYIVRTQDFVFLSGLVSRRGVDDQAVAGPMATQVKTVLDNAAELLKTAGVSFDDVVSARVFITDAAAFQDMNGEYRKYFAKDPPVRATVVAGLMGPTSTVEITLVASRVGRQVLVPGSGTTPLSGAIRAGGLVFLSGVLGNNNTNATDVGAQTRETLARISKSLQTAGISFANVAENVVYLPDLAAMAAVRPILREFFPKDAPAETVVGAKLVAATGLIELMMTAAAK